MKVSTSLHSKPKWYKGLFAVQLLSQQVGLLPFDCGLVHLDLTPNFFQLPAAAASCLGAWRLKHEPVFCSLARIFPPTLKLA